MAQDIQRHPIADLFPYESAGVSGAIARHKRTLKRKKELAPVGVLEVDGEYLVINGTNRVLASLEMGSTDVPVAFVHKHEQELGPYRDALKEAKTKNHKGFQNMPSGGKGERADAYRAGERSVIDELLKKPQEPRDGDEK